jgi:coiled-coil and C2 domain-containing protein 2A
MITEPSYCSLSLNSWIKQDYRLVIDLVGLQFTSHPLILEEQRLAIQIRTLVQTTIERKRSNVANFLAIKLKSLREYYQSIKDDYNKLNAQLPSSEGVMQMINTKKLDTLRIESERLQRKALKEIISVRLARDAENKSDMMLEFEIVKAWDLLKRIRKGTGLISTSLKLFIKAKKIKVENFDPKIEAKAEMQERIELYDLEVRNKRRQFSRSREQWLEQMRILENEGGETSSMENALSIQSLEKKASNISEPVEEAYEPFQKRKYKDEIKQRLKASHRPAESAILSFYVEETEAITPNISCTLEEQYRRSQVENTRYQLVLYYNQMKITTSNPKHLDPISFRMEAQNLKDNDWQPLVLKSANLPRSSFVIRVVEPPKSIAIEILECNPYGTSVVAKVYLPIPLSNELSTTKDRAVKNVEFCGDSDGFKFKGLTRYEGILKANTSWGVDSVGNVLGPTSQAPNKLKVRLPTHLYKLAQLMHWNDTLSFDRNDPRNYDLKQLRDLIDQKCSELGIDYISKNYFSLGIPDWLRKITVGISISEMDQERITLLRQRFGKNRGCNLSVSISGGLNENPKSHVLNSTRFYKKIRAEKLLKKALLAIPSHVDKYVHELRYEPIEQEPFWMLLLFRPNRPLNPVRNTRIQTVTSSPNQCKLLVQVSRALNIAKPIGSKEVRSFVEVSFQRKSVRSDTKTGINPLWNQTLKLSITSDTDFEPENLMKSDIVTEMVYINIFSESLVDILQDEGDRGSYIHNRIDRVWLGGMKLPFSQIWERTKIGGGFPIVIPSSLKLDRQLDDSGNVGKSVLHLFLTLDPPLLQPPKITLKVMFLNLVSN